MPDVNFLIPFFCLMVRTLRQRTSVDLMAGHIASSPSSVSLALNMLTWPWRRALVRSWALSNQWRYTDLLLLQSPRPAWSGFCVRGCMSASLTKKTFGMNWHRHATPSGTATIQVIPAIFHYCGETVCSLQKLYRLTTLHEGKGKHLLVISYDSKDISRNYSPSSQFQTRHCCFDRYLSFLFLARTVLN